MDPAGEGAAPCFTFRLVPPPPQEGRASVQATACTAEIQDIKGLTVAVSLTTLGDEPDPPTE